MKASIIILSVVLAALLALTGLVLFSDRQDPSPATVPTTEPTTQESTTEPTVETTSEPPTEPEPTVLEYHEQEVYLDGQPLPLYSIEGELYLRAENLSVEAEPYIVGGEAYLPYDAVVDAWGYPVYVDDETGITYLTPSAVRFALPENVNVPVLMYHAVSDNMWGINELFVSPSSMEEQLAYLVENDYDPIWFEDLAHIEDYDKPVILTFDDGYDDNYTELYPLLQKYNVKATIFVIGDAIGTNHKMTAEQVRELADSGLVSIQSHAFTHADLDTLSLESQRYEMSESKRALVRVTGREPHVLCYPTGRYNGDTLAVIGDYYQFGLKMVGGLYNTSDDPYQVNRYYISRYTDIYTFAAYIADAGT